MSIRLRTLLGFRFWLGLIISLSFVNAGCDALGIGKEEKKSKKSSKDDDEDEDDAKKKKKKKKDDEEEDEDKPKSKSSASAAASGTPSTEESAAPVADGSTGLKECDEYLAKFEKSVKPKPEDLKNMREAFKTGAKYSAETTKKSCSDGLEALKKAFPDK